MNKHIQSLPLVLSMMLTACASVPSGAPRRPVVKAVPAAPAVHAIEPPRETASPPMVDSDVWERLRDSFVMADCDADPSVLRQARHDTRHPRQFEKRLREVLPRLVYVQQLAARYDVAGEFVLLPWVESHFRPVSGSRHRPAGMWQIMPVTAGAMGLRVDAHYDGRLDVTAAANAVMKLLKQYHDQFHDWRVADYAYNAGEYSIRKIIRKHGLPADEPVIPQWPVRRVTREHLTKLLAIACVVREPARFHVSLPRLPGEQHLVRIPITHSMPMARAADHAGMSVDSLKDLNAAFRSDMINPRVSSYLLLPRGHVQQFRDALLNRPESASADIRPTATRAHAAVATTDQRQRKTYTVVRGDSLWQIARDCSVTVAQLQRWNHLAGHTLKPGQILQINGAD
jgi:membrane-bound lytic murein transglycosylase D